LAHRLDWGVIETLTDIQSNRSQPNTNCHYDTTNYPHMELL